MAYGAVSAPLSTILCMEPKPLTDWVFLSDVCEARGITRSREAQERSLAGVDLLMARIRNTRTRRPQMAVDSESYIRWLDGFLADGLDPEIADRIMARAFTFGGHDE